MDVDELVRDALPVNPPYDGLVAQAYDTWLPPDGNYLDRDLYRDVIRSGDGPALELGCGNGRLLVGYAAEGLDVEGCDSSADILERCRARLAEVGADATLHHVDWVHLDLPRRYARLYNPAGSFSLLDDRDAACTALASWRAHLVDGGQLVVAMGVPGEEQERPWTWRVRRSATRPSDGVTFLVHEAGTLDRDEQVQDVLNRHEVWDADGTLQTTFLRRHRLRWWTPDQLREALQDAGFGKVSIAGDDEAYLAFARTG